MDFGLLGMDGADHLFVVRRDLHRRMEILQAGGNDFRAEAF